MPSGVNPTESSKTAGDKVYGPVTGGFLFRDATECTTAQTRNKSETDQWERNDKTEMQQRRRTKIQTNHDEDMETEI